MPSLSQLAVILVLAASCARELPAEPAASPAAAIVKSEVLASGLRLPWSMAFAPNGDLLIVEKAGGLRLFRDGVLSPNAISGGPDDVMVSADSGLHDIALDPDFAANGQVYVAYASGDEGANRLPSGVRASMEIVSSTARSFFAQRRTRKVPATPAGGCCFCLTRHSC